MKIPTDSKPSGSSSSSKDVQLAPPSPCKPLSRRSLFLRQLVLFYRALKLRDDRSRYPWRLLAAAAIVCSVLSLTNIILTSILGSLPAAVHMMPGTSLYQRYETIFYNDSDFAYVPDSSLMITTTAKAGSTTLWTWLHRGITGRPSFDECGDTYIQNFSAPCWQGKVLHPFNMTDAERWRIVNRPEVLRVAITRDPYERLVSAWKSKAACDSDDFGTDVADRDKIVPIMLQQAKIDKAVTCLSLASFAEVLEKLRMMSLNNTFDIRDLNKHFRPQEYYFKDIPYDIVLDVNEITNLTKLAPIKDRLKHADLLDASLPTLHTSRTSLLMMSEKTAALLHKFAMFTEPFSA